jgi:predicted dehydrogenase
MKALVLGGGSIGKRHLHNMKALGVEQLGLVEPDAARRELLSQELHLSAFANLEDGLLWSPDFVLIATPTHLHVEQANRVAQGGFDLFVEKPLSHNSEGLEALSKLVDEKKLVSLVGCNMRFHPGPAKVKQLLDEKRLGRILFARVHCGSYLPEWRPGSDYRRNYAAKEATGGGCILDCIHEIDLARWYLGDVEEVSCTAGHLSSLEIETEDIAILVCRHRGGAISEVHLDYVQRTYERGCQLVGEAGSIFWDFTGKQVRWYDAASGGWKVFDQGASWQVNQIYLDEMQHFVECVRSRKQTVLPIREAVSVMQIAFAAKQSARQRAAVSIGKTLPA